MEAVATVIRTHEIPGIKVFEYAARYYSRHIDPARAYEHALQSDVVPGFVNDWCHGVLKGEIELPKTERPLLV